MISPQVDMNILSLTPSITVDMVLHICCMIIDLMNLYDVSLYSPLQVFENPNTQNQAN